MRGREIGLERTLGKEPDSNYAQFTGDQRVQFIETTTIAPLICSEFDVNLPVSLNMHSITHASLKDGIWAGFRPGGLPVSSLFNSLARLKYVNLSETEESQTAQNEINNSGHGRAGLTGRYLTSAFQVIMSIL
jgi:hypothetical protein